MSLGSGFGRFIGTVKLAHLSLCIVMLSSHLERPRSQLQLALDNFWGDASRRDRASSALSRSLSL